jgi:hypothetical protein
MSKLSEVYDLIAGLQKRNLPVPKELQQEATELEIDELREELAVAVEEHVQPVLDRIKSNWVLVLHHRPDASVRMVATREEEVLSLLDDAVELLPAVSRAAVPAPEPEPQPASYTEVVEEEEPNTVADEGRAQSIGFSVRFADGTIIDEADAKTTLVNTLRYMGFEQVAQFTMVRFGKGVYPLVCRSGRERMVCLHQYGQPDEEAHPYVGRRVSGASDNHHRPPAAGIVPRYASCAYSHFAPEG